MEAIALHDFTATSEDELSFMKGSTVKILKKGPLWHKAEQYGREGLVPKNYMVQPRCGRGRIRVIAASVPGGRVHHAGESKNGVQHLKVFRDNGGKYFIWDVKCNSLNSIVTYYLNSLVSRTEEVILRLPDMYTALFDFDGKEDNELTFKAGDSIVVLEKSDADWWRGTCDGKVGDFPCTYVNPSEY